MKRTAKGFFKLISKLILTALVFYVLLYAWNPLMRMFYDVTGEITVQSAVLRQKLESSKRLEVTKVDEEGTLHAETSVIIFGTVGSTTIRYRYTASLGIDLGKVIMTNDGDRIVFALPETEVLNDGIEALEINKHNFFSKAIEKSVETLLNEQRIQCREQYLNEKQHSERTWEDTVKAFDETICTWLDAYGERHYQFEYVTQEGIQTD